MKVNIKRIAAAGTLTAVALIFSYVETLISSFIPVPGVRLGIANIVVVLALFMMGPWDALAIGLLRIVISSQNSSITGIWWDDMMIYLFLAISSRITLLKRSVLTGSRPESGSSRIRN